MVAGSSRGRHASGRREARRRPAVCIPLLAFLLLMGSMAQADVIFNVDTTDDLVDADTSDGVCRTSANSCSLRAAIMQANQIGEPGLALIAVPAGTYVLTRAPNGTDGDASGDLNLTSPTTSGQTVLVSGAGAGTTIIDGGGHGRVFDVAAGRAVGLSRLGVRNGSAGALYGGGVNNLGILVVVDCIIENNQAEVGGGLFSSGLLSVVRSTLRANRAIEIGGGLAISPNADSDVSSSAIYGNSANEGGGVYVYNDAAQAQVSLINTTITLNSVNDNGGGLTVNGDVSLYNVTIVANNADADHDENGGNGGGIYARDAASQPVLFNSIVADNTVQGFFANDCDGPLRTFGQNFSTDAGMPDCVVTGPPPAAITLSTIGPLQDNGGPTFSRALLAGSEAIDSTPDDLGCVGSDGFLLHADQRGSVRPIGARCDAGAFEYGSFPGDVVFRNGFDISL